MPTTSFKDYCVDISPPWLRNNLGEAYQRGVGDVKDWLLARLKESVKARFANLAPRDALTQIGGERQLPRAAGETDATYAARLVGAWDTWPYAGTAFGMLRALYVAGYSNIPMLISAKGQSHQLSSDGETMVITNAPGGITFIPSTYWAAFKLYFPTLPPAWSGVVPSSSSAEAQFIMSLVKKWKSAIARFDAVIIQQTGLLWGIPFANVWGIASPKVWGGTSVTWTPP